MIRGGPRAARILVLVLGITVAACGSTPPSTPPVATAAASAPVRSSPPTTPAASAPSAATPAPSAAADAPPLTAADVVPGLYLHPDLSVSGDDQVTILRSTRPCPELVELVEAGEWTITDRQDAATPEVADGRPYLTILTLARGEETAFAWIAGGDQCTARVSRTTTAGVTVSGAASVEGPAPRDVPYCVVTDTKVQIGAVFRPGGGPSVFVQLTAPVRRGPVEVVATDVEIGVERRALDAPGLAGILMAGFRDAEAGRFAETYEATDERATATLDVSSVEPYVATFRATGYEGPRGRLDLVADLACHIPGSALTRTAEAAAIAAAATPTPTAPPPTLGTIAPAGPASVVATGGAIAGTYPIPESDLVCFHDPDAGTWAVTTVGGGGGHSLFVTVSAAAAGGSSEAVSIGLVVGDGSGDRIALVDTLASPPSGVGRGSVRVDGGQVAIQAEGRTPEGVALAVNLTCRP